MSTLGVMDDHQKLARHTMQPHQSNSPKLQLRLWLEGVMGKNNIRKCGTAKRAERGLRFSCSANPGANFPCHQCQFCGCGIKRQIIKSITPSDAPPDERNIKQSSKNTSAEKSLKGIVLKNRQRLLTIEAQLLKSGFKLSIAKYAPTQQVNCRSARFSEPLFWKKSLSQNSLKGHLDETKDESIIESNKYSRPCEAPIQQKHPQIKDFDIGKLIGAGKYGKVKLAKHRLTGFLFALKIISKSLVSQPTFSEALIQEINLQSRIQHPNIVKLYSCFSDDQNIYLLMELCPDGDLFNHLKDRVVLHQKQALNIIKPICEATEELHINGIMHRDLKLQNIVLGFGTPKICDFGLSVSLAETISRKTICGTPTYISPQILMGCQYNEKADVWALGILGYELLTGKVPFGLSQNKNLSRIVTSEVDFPEQLGPLVRNLLSLFLTKSPQNRKSISEILNHPILNGLQ